MRSLFFWAEDLRYARSILRYARSILRYARSIPKKTVDLNKYKCYTSIIITQHT